jgi:RecA-family ATPase
MSNSQHKDKFTSAVIKEQVAADADKLRKEVRSSYSNEITAEDLLKREVESIPCLIEPILQRVGLAAVVGSSDVGKSAFLRQLAFAIGTGEETFLDWKIKAKHQSAIYVSTEDDENATAFLLHSLNKQKGKDPALCNGLRFAFDTYNLLDELNHRLTQTPADLVVIDAFGDLYGGDANRSNEIRKFLHDYSQLAQKHECLVLWLHHTGKRTDEEAPSKHHVIGGQGFEGKMRLLIELRRDHRDNSRRHLCIVKGNYLSDDFKEESYVLKFKDFQFERTEERVQFEELAKIKVVRAEDNNAILQNILALQAKGYTQQEIADELGYKSKGTISKILSRNKSDEVSNQFPGNV